MLPRKRRTAMNSLTVAFLLSFLFSIVVFIVLFFVSFQPELNEMKRISSLPGLQHYRSNQ